MFVSRYSYSRRCFALAPVWFGPLVSPTIAVQFALVTWRGMTPNRGKASLSSV